MTNKYVFSVLAEQDIKDIWRYIALDNEDAADHFVRRILDKVELATAQNFIGVRRPELSATARMLVEGSYIIIYEPTDDGIFVVRIVHGGRDPTNWLG